MTLLTYIRHGMKLVRIRKALAFHQSRFLAPYIEKCAQLRKEAKSPFEKNLYKLMSNAVSTIDCKLQTKNFFII